MVRIRPKQSSMTSVNLVGTGSIVRISPNEVAVADIDSFHQIHWIGSEFRKSAWYQNQSPSQYNDETCGVFGLRGIKNAKVRRKYLQQVATRNNVAEWEPQIKETVHRALSKIKRDAQNGKADILKWWFFMTADVLGEVAFGEEFGMVNGEKKTQMMLGLDSVMNLIGIKMELPWIWEILKILPIPAARKAYNNIYRFNDYGAVALKNAKSAAAGKTRTLLSKMYPEDGSPALPDSILQMEALNLIIAGTDTTTMTITHLIYAILSHEPVKQRLIAELNACSAAPNSQELERLPYTNAVIHESMRLYPAIPGSLPRNVPPGGAVLGGYFIPEDMTVSSQSFTLHRDSSVWLDPERFNPDRWLNPTSEMQDYFNPWGGSARICLGQNVARVQILHAVHAFFTQLPNAKLLPTTNNESMDPVDFFTVKPKAGVCEITAV